MRPAAGQPAPEIDSSSDTECWFLLALMEHAGTERGAGFLESRMPFCDGPEVTIWEHARAFDLLTAVAKKRGDTVLAEEAAAACQHLREAARAVFDRTHFPRGFTDAGRPVGSTADDRCFINAQSWAALGRCGTPEQRRTALLHALELAPIRVAWPW